MDLSAHLQQLSRHPNNYSVLYDFLHYMRQNALRRSDMVVKYGEILLKNHSSKLGDDVWTVLEQVFIAALDINHLKLAEECLSKLRKKFPSSLRVKRLEGLKLEAEGKFEEAREHYDSLLRDDHLNIPILKRQIGILKGNGKIPQAIAKLNDYLRVYMTDLEAWQELSELYLSQQQYKNAEFCCEELILASPQNALYHRRYAEILYSLGGLENFKLARSYFAHSLELSSSSSSSSSSTSRSLPPLNSSLSFSSLSPSDFSTRSLFGLAITAAAIASSKKGYQVKDNSEVLEWCRKKLLMKYKEVDSEKVPWIERIFIKLQERSHKESRE